MSLADVYLTLTGWQAAAIVATPVVAGALAYLVGYVTGRTRAPAYMVKRAQNADGDLAAERAMRKVAERRLVAVEARLATLAGIASRLEAQARVEA